MPIAIGIKGQG